MSTTRLTLLPNHNPQLKPTTAASAEAAPAPAEGGAEGAVVKPAAVASSGSSKTALMDRLAALKSKQKAASS